MDYNLAKKLKDSGFPKLQEWDEDIVFGGDIWNELYAPTLSELIAACGKTYKNYEFFLLWSKNKWFAGYFDGEFEQPEGFYAGEGKTETEAVANLWLALRGK